MAQSGYNLLPGFAGIYTRTLKQGDLAYYVTLRGRDGAWFRRNVGRHSQGMRPKVAAARQDELQREIDRRRDPAAMAAVTFSQAYENFLLQKQAAGSDITRDINRWDLYLAPLANVPLSKLDTRDFNQMLTAMRAKRLSDGYLEKVFGQARTIISWAIKADLWDGKNPLGRDSTFRMPAWRKNAMPSRWFTPEEAQRLLEEVRIRSEDLYRMSLLSLSTGMRAMEIWGLGELEDALDRANGQLNFVGKSGAREFVYAGDEVFDLLEEYGRQPGELIFQMRGGGRIYKTSKTFVRAIEAAGLASKTHKVWFHSWRHTFGSWLAQSGQFTLYEIMEYMRHSDDRMTRHYAKLIPGNRRERLAVIKDRLDGVKSSEEEKLKPRLLTFRRRIG
jgi:integrase